MLLLWSGKLSISKKAKIPKGNSLYKISAYKKASKLPAARHVLMLWLARRLVRAFPLDDVFRVSTPHRSHKVSPATRRVRLHLTQARKYRGWKRTHADPTRWTGGRHQLSTAAGGRPQAAGACRVRVCACRIQAKRTVVPTSRTRARPPPPPGSERGTTCTCDDYYNHASVRRPPRALRNPSLPACRCPVGIEGRSFGQDTLLFKAPARIASMVS